MTVHHGNDGSVDVGSDLVAEVQEWTYEEEDVAVAELTSMGDTVATPLLSGCIRGSGTVKCALDEDDTNGQVALEAAVGNDTGVTLHLFGEGQTSGDFEYTGTAKVTKSARGVDKSKLNEISFDFVGVLTRQAVP